MVARDVVIYTTMFCSYCQRAKALLTRKAIAFTEIPVDGDRAAREAMVERSNGQRTVPQIFIGQRHIGGSDELYQLDASGELDKLILTPAG